MANVKETYIEAERMEDLMFEALVAESNLNRRQIKKMLRENTDRFFSAEEAVEMGIADIIV